MGNKDSKVKQLLMPAIKLLIAGGIIAWLVMSGRFDLNSLQKISSVWIWLAGVVGFFAVVSINAHRWQLLLAMESVNISFWHSLRLSTMGIFFNFVSLGGVGGDVVKAGYLMTDFRDKKWFIGWSVLVDRVLGMLALLTYSAVTGLIFYKKLPEKLQLSFLSLSLMILLGMVALILILVFSPKDKIDRLLRSHPLTEKTLLSLFYFFREPRKVLKPFLLSLVGQGTVVGLGVMLHTILGMSFPVWMVLLIFPFGMLATVLPLAPAGVGVGQAAFFYLFDIVANNGEFGVLSITFFQAVQFIVGLFGGVFFVLYKGKEA